MLLLSSYPELQLTRLQLQLLSDHINLSSPLLTNRSGTSVPRICDVMIEVMVFVMR